MMLVGRATKTSRVNIGNDDAGNSPDAKLDDNEALTTESDNEIGNDKHKIRIMNLSWKDHEKREKCLPNVMLTFTIDNSRATIRLHYKLRIPKAKHAFVYISISPENIKSLDYKEAENMGSKSTLEISMQAPPDILSDKDIRPPNQERLNKQLCTLRDLSSATQLSLSFDSYRLRKDVIDSFLYHFSPESKGTELSPERTDLVRDRRRDNNTFLYRFQDGKFVNAGKLKEITADPPPYHVVENRPKSSRKRRRRDSDSDDDESDDKLMMKKDYGPRGKALIESRLRQIELEIQTLPGLAARIESLEKTVSDWPACEHTQCRYDSEEEANLGEENDRFDNRLRDLERHSDYVKEGLENMVEEATENIRHEMGDYMSEQQNDDLNHLKDMMKKSMSRFEQEIKNLVENAVKKSVNDKIKDIMPQLEEKALESVGNVIEDKVKGILGGASLALNIQ